MPASITLPSATSYNFITISGDFPRLGMAVEPLERPGYDGYGYRQIGQRSEIKQMVAILDCDSAAAAEGVINTLTAAQGSLVTIANDSGTAKGNLLLLRVTALDGRKIAGASGGVSTTKGYLLTIALDLQAAIAAAPEP